MNIDEKQDCQAAASAEQSSVRSLQAILQMSFEEIEAWRPPPDAQSNLASREAFLLKPVADSTSIPPNDEVRIEDLAITDLDLPIDFI